MTRACRVPGRCVERRGGAAAAFVAVLAAFRIVSLSSMLAALTAIALVCGLEQPMPYRLLVIAGGLYIIVRHRANVHRLLAGTEPRVGRERLTLLVEMRSRRWP
jgi:glycerol-3-phosphate acyltransferase PlsY